MAYRKTSDRRKRPACVQHVFGVEKWFATGHRPMFRRGVLNLLESSWNRDEIVII